MNIHNMVHHYFSRSSIFTMIPSNNHLGIDKIDCIKDNQRSRLVILITVNQPVGNEIYAFMKGQDLILEASIPPDFIERPVRTHLIGKEFMDEMMDGDLDIGFSEINLNPEFHFEVQSYQQMNPGFFKIVLSYSPVKSNRNKDLN